MSNNPIPKIGMTFPKPESIMEQPTVPFSFDFEKLLPEKVGRTFPRTQVIHRATALLDNISKQSVHFSKERHNIN